MNLEALTIGDSPEAWAALGFAVSGGGVCLIGGVALQLGEADAGPGISAWSLPAVDGLARAAPPAAVERPDAAVEHPNGAVSLDHVVVMTPDFDRTAGALGAAGLEFRRIREVGGGPDQGGFRQGFRRVGPTILEVVEARDGSDGPARFWGLVVIVSDLDSLAKRLGPLLKPIKPAVQPGRRIATLDRAAGVTPAIAFMDPEPSASAAV